MATLDQSGLELEEKTPVSSPLPVGSDKSITSSKIELDSSTVEAIRSNGATVLDDVKQWLDSIKDSQPEMINASTTAYDERFERLNKDDDGLGMTALCLAAEQNNVKVAQLLLDAGAEIGHGRNALHIACSLPHDEDVTEMVTLLVDRNAPISTFGISVYPPLHLAAKNGHEAAVELLLDNGADMAKKTKEGDTPVHLATLNGHAGVVQEMIRRDPSCVQWRNDNDETPLHIAAEKRHFNLVQIILSDAEPDVNAQDECGHTPLCLVAFNGSTQVAKLLIEKGALVNPPVLDYNPYRQYSPLGYAVAFGMTDLVLYLLKEGAKVRGAEFLEIINEGLESVAAVVVNSSQWAVALRYTAPGDKTTPFRELIRKMPNVAEDVLNKCVVPRSIETENKFYDVEYNYEFIEDFKDGTKTGVEETDGCGYADNWGPSKFSMSNHPLAIMVQEEHLNLLSHPVVGSLLHHKWNKFGLYGYFFNLLTYCVFLIFLTAFALEVPNPLADICM